MKSPTSSTPSTATSPAGQADFSSAIAYFGGGDPTDGLAQFFNGVNGLPSLSNYADVYFSDAVTAFTASDFATAAYDSSIGALYTFDLPWETLIQGAADSLGF
jgi:hypothetical protein